MLQLYTMISIKFAALQTAVNDLEIIIQEKGKEIIPTCKISEHFQTKCVFLSCTIIFFLYYTARFMIFVLLLKLKYIQNKTVAELPVLQSYTIWLCRDLISKQKIYIRFGRPLLKKCSMGNFHAPHSTLLPSGK